MTSTESPIGKPRIAVVTGATSGIGRSIALQLARDGMSLVLHGRKPSERMTQVEGEIQTIVDSNGVSQQVGSVFGDFSEELNWQNFVDDAWDVFGSFDCWVNNAGGDVLTGQWRDRPIEEKLAYLWKTDVTSSLMLSRLAGQRMRGGLAADSSGVGSIVNIGWDQAANGMDGDSGELFATTKGAIMAMSKSLAQSLAPTVRVNCVAPGWIQTSWGQQTSEYWDRRAKRESLMDRWGSPQDIASAVAFLCKPESNFISGQVLPVNGGFRFGFK